ncbi:MAG: protease [Gammaproteobacteria bacterium RIFCSPLOWO2_02_FULL_61_13]|nr:MAG: protease [Gammaproteobacteria bacterium RIFCSPLOWO2_02_FULL_61_13]
MHRPELVCPAGTPAGLHAAVDAGADAVYCGFQGPTNARNFPGLNFSPREMEQAVTYAHDRGTKVLAAINSFPPAGQMAAWKRAVDDAVRFGMDAVIVADIGVAAYTARMHPDQRLHLSVQAGASSPEAINFYCREFGVRRVVLPRILTVAEIKGIHAQIPCEIEAFIFGNIGMMAEGRCSLSAYATGQSTNMDGVCSPASHVHYLQDEGGNLKSLLGEFTIDCFTCDESAGYPTICKGRYDTEIRTGYYAFEEPVSLNLTPLLPELMRAGVTALKIEGRQRSRAYVAAVVAAFRKAVDACMENRVPDMAGLIALTEGHRETQGAFGGRKWR